MSTTTATSSREESPVVLIIEDDPATAELYSVLFDQSGLQTVVAHDSSTAQDYLRSAQPDALVLDVMMPDESGLELCRSLRSSPHYADVPVIMVSALARQEDVQAGLEAGASAYLSKPVSPGMLTETVPKVDREGRLPTAAAIDHGTPGDGSAADRHRSETPHRPDRQGPSGL